jgi:hypothetical protein
VWTGGTDEFLARAEVAHAHWISRRGERGCVQAVGHLALRASLRALQGPETRNLPTGQTPTTYAFVMSWLVQAHTTRP